MPSVGRTKTRGASQAVPVWNAFKTLNSIKIYSGDNYLLDRTKTRGAFQAVPVWNVQAIIINFYKLSEPTTIEQDQDEWRLASGAGRDRSKLSLYQFFKQTDPLEKRS